MIFDDSFVYGFVVEMKIIMFYRLVCIWYCLPSVLNRNPILAPGVRMSLLWLKMIVITKNLLLLLSKWLKRWIFCRMTRNISLWYYEFWFDNIKKVLNMNFRIRYYLEQNSKIPVKVFVSEYKRFFVGWNV